MSQTRFGMWLVLSGCFVLFLFFCFLASHIEWKQRGSDRKSSGCLLNCGRLFGFLSQTCPPISPVICARLGQSWSRVAMARDCLHPVMLYSHVGAHSLQRPLLCFSRTPSLCPRPPRCWRTGPRLRHGHRLKGSVAACFTPSRCCKCVCYFNSVAAQLRSTKEALSGV